MPRRSHIVRAVVFTNAIERFRLPAVLAWLALYAGTIGYVIATA